MTTDDDIPRLLDEITVDVVSMIHQEWWDKNPNVLDCDASFRPVNYIWSVSAGGHALKSTSTTKYLYNTRWSCSFTGLKPKTMYELKVVTVNSKGTSPVVATYAQTS